MRVSASSPQDGSVGARAPRVRVGRRPGWHVTVLGLPLPVQTPLATERAKGLPDTGGEKLQGGHQEGRVAFSFLALEVQGKRVAPEELKSLLAENLKKYPTSRHLLIIRDEGGGFVGMGKTNGKFIPPGLLAEVVNGAQRRARVHLDLIFLDAAFMGEVETALEWGKSARYLISSQENVDKPFPIDRFAETTVEREKRSPSPLQMGKLLVRAREESEGFRTLSLVSLGNPVKALAKGIDALGRILTVSVVEGLTPAETFLAIVKESQSFSQEASFLKPFADCRDIKDIATRLVKDPRVTDARVKEAAKQVVDLFSKAVVASSSGQSGYGGASGLSIYAPVEAGPDYGHRGTAFAASFSGWDRLLQLLGSLALNPPPQDPVSSGSGA